MPMHMQNFKKFRFKLFKKILKTTFFCYIVARDERLKVSRRRGALPPPKKFFIAPRRPPSSYRARECLPEKGATMSTKCRCPALLRSVCVVQLVLLPVRPRTRSATLDYAPTECFDLWAVGSFLSHILSLRTQKKIILN